MMMMLVLRWTTSTALLLQFLSLLLLVAEGYNDHHFQQYRTSSETGGRPFQAATSARWLQQQRRRRKQQQQQQTSLNLFGRGNRQREAEKVSPPPPPQQQQQQQLAQQEAQYPPVLPPSPPPAPEELPLRFLRAGKGDPVKGYRRYQKTLKWRARYRMDTILREPCLEYDLIKQHYPHYYHLRGRNHEPVFFEQPARVNLRALRQGGVDAEKLTRYYMMITEYQWQYLEPNDLASSIYIIDLDGLRLRDFVGDVVSFVRRVSKLSAQHYPERAGYVFVLHVPRFFKVIWSVVRPIVDDSTLHKIYILRNNEEILKAMEERIPLENIPPEYGGTSMPLGKAPEEQTLRDLIRHNNRLAQKPGRYVCENCKGSNPDDWHCPFCRWRPARSY